MAATTQDGDRNGKCWPTCHITGPHFVMALYVYVNLRILLSVYFQYQHDFSLLRLNRFLHGEGMTNLTELALLTRVNRSQLGVEALSLLEQVEESSRKLALIGAPHRSCFMFTECVYLAIIGTTYFIYFNMNIYFNSIRSMDLHFSNMLLDKENELKLCRQLAESEARLVLKSSSNAIYNLLDRVLDCEEILKRSRSASVPKLVAAKRCSSWQLVNWPVKGFTGPGEGSGATACELSSMIKGHRLLCKHVHQLQAANQLDPINRSREYVDQMAKEFSMFSMSNLSYSILQDILLVFFLPGQVGARVSLESWPDYWLLLDLWILILISLNSTVYYIAMLSVNSTDQNRYLAQLRANFGDCIKENEIKLSQLLLGHNNEAFADPQRVFEEVNKNVVKSILEFRIFIAQFRPVRRTFSFIALTSFLVIVFVLLMICFHLPYYSSIEVKLFGVFMSLVIVALADSSLLPICLVHYQGVRLYRLMASMLAHTIEMNQLGVFDGANYCVYHKHTVDMLRRILSDPRRFTGQFAARALPGVLLTFATLVKIHFWYTLLYLSSTLQMHSWKSLFGSRLQDPFGVFKEMDSKWNAKVGEVR